MREPVVVDPNESMSWSKKWIAFKTILGPRSVIFRRFSRVPFFVDFWDDFSEKH